ncbi:MAG: anhydro-N-acetylmuramic acid kinase [Candidatus Rariloculaceae bacterium]
MGGLYIGLMSGTSLDGADVAIVDLDDTSCVLHSAETTPFPTNLAARLRSLSESPETTLVELGTLDTELGGYFADCVNTSLRSLGRSADDIVALGYSGHTVFHKPTQPHAFTMQIGDPNAIAAATGIEVVADFRRMDVAHGGQGAPLAPAFHAWRFADPEEVRVALNLGGVANITVLDPTQSLTGYDTGPANSLMDAWCRRYWNERFDVDGKRARGGEVAQDLLDVFLADPYFRRQAPKSTGFEHFNIGWVMDKLAQYSREIEPDDVLATLTELTAASVGNAIRSSAPKASRVILCGGGTFNSYLIERLGTHLPDCVLAPSSEHGVDPEWVEAVAFAWLARMRLQNKPGNAVAVTGARHTTTLGGIYLSKQRS